MKFSAQALINAPVHKIWSLIDEPESWPEWIPSFKKVEVLTAGPIRKGSSLVIKAKLGLFTFNVPVKVIVFEKEKQVILQASSLFSTLERFYYFQPEGHQTKVVIGGEIKGLLASFGAKKGKLISQEILRSMEQKVAAVHSS